MTSAVMLPQDRENSSTADRQRIVTFSKTALGLLGTIFLLTPGGLLPVQAQSASEIAEIERLTQDPEQMEREMESILQSLEELEELGQQLDNLRLNHPTQTSDSSTEDEFIQRSIERMPAYEADLADCSPATYEDFPLPGVTEAIRGWAGDTCQVDIRTDLEDFQSISQCFYTRQDIELITGPELYLPDDLERQCHRIK